MPTLRKAFVMSVHPGLENEYERRHAEIWPEMKRLLEDHGVYNYSIFLHPETHQLFAFVEIEDEARWAAISKTAVCQRWWQWMREIMPSNPDASPVSRELEEVFYFKPGVADLQQRHGGAPRQ